LRSTNQNIKKRLSGFLDTMIPKNPEIPLKNISNAFGLRINFFGALDGIYCCTYYDCQRQYRKYLFHNLMVLFKDE